MMITSPRSSASKGTPKPAKRSLFGVLFNPQLGATIQPLRDNTRVFVQLVAQVFAIYKLIPKDYPGLRDETTPLSFVQVIANAWQNIRLTKEGAPQAIMFFAIVGIILFSAFLAVSTLLSFFVAHAHAATPDSSLFAPEQNDIAQKWLDYLFVDGSTYPTASFSASDGTASSLDNPFSGSVSLQSALLSALAIYSNAILIVAAIILFYHLTAMVVETAHHGVPMGKRASQIWAPIRLVVAIGLLVPINNGLNCGQFIVIKMAELGSGLASHVWDGFLTTVQNYSTKPVIPPAKMQNSVAADIILMQACTIAWNTRISNINNALAADAAAVNSAAANTGVEPVSPGKFSAAAINPASASAFTLGNTPGTKYSFSSNSLADVDVCGWYFIPSSGNNQLAIDAATAQADAIKTATPQIMAAANEIVPLIPSDGQAANTNTAATGLKFDDAFRTAVSAYQQALGTAMQAITQKNSSQISDAITAMKPYGWVTAGTFLNTIDRVQAGVSAAVSGSTPKTETPQSLTVSDDQRPSGVAAFLRHWLVPDWAAGAVGGNTNAAWDIRKLVAGDMAAFSKYVMTSITNPNNKPTDAASQCAAMTGLSNSGSQGAGSWGAEKIFEQIDTLATYNGVWSNGTGSQCQNASSSQGQVFTLGIQFKGTDPLSQMAFLGHANLETAFDLIGLALGGGLIVGLISSTLASMVSGIFIFFATVFWIAGFTLAFLVPLMPFMRFFFAVLSWVAGVIEAVVAIPLVALAHLSPEGEGLAGPAKGAYLYIFNLFLRPVLIIFGLVCGFIIFFVSLSFLNFAYGTAVAGAGGTAYGMASMSKMIYSILYVVIVYISANHSFRLIDHLPAHALQWMGASGQSFAEMGNVDRVETLGAAISGYVGKDVAGKVAAGGAGVAKGMLGNDLVGKLRDDQKQKKLSTAEQKATLASDQKQDARTDRIIGAIGGLGGMSGQGNGGAGGSVSATGDSPHAMADAVNEGFNYGARGMALPDNLMNNSNAVNAHSQALKNFNISQKADSEAGQINNSYRKPDEKPASDFQSRQKEQGGSLKGLQKPQRPSGNQDS